MDTPNIEYIIYDNTHQPPENFWPSFAKLDNELSRIHFEEYYHFRYSNRDLVTANLCKKEYQDLCKKKINLWYLCALDQGKYVGILMLVTRKRVSKPILYYSELIVIASYRGLGIGSTLMDMAEEIFEQGYETATIRVAAVNQVAIGLYRRYGFKDHRVILSFDCKTPYDTELTFQPDAKDQWKTDGTLDAIKEYYKDNPKAVEAYTKALKNKELDIAHWSNGTPAIYYYNLRVRTRKFLYLWEVFQHYTTHDRDLVQQQMYALQNFAISLNRDAIWICDLNIPDAEVWKTTGGRDLCYTLMKTK